MKRNPSSKGVKVCWISRQTSKGYRLALSVGNQQFNVRGLLLGSPKDVEHVLKTGIVFVHLSTYVEPKKASKKPAKKAKR